MFLPSWRPIAVPWHTKHRKVAQDRCLENTFKTVLKKLRNVTKKGPNIELTKDHFLKYFRALRPKVPQGGAKDPPRHPTRPQK